MFLPLVRSCFRSWLVPDARIWILAVVLAGMLVSSIGLMNSHGLAALACAQHRADSAQGLGHEHSHHDESEATGAETSLAHAHHNADHTHDNAQVPSMALRSVAPSLPDWRIFAPARKKGLVAYRLERPPMA
jgi:hypothetical protein